jgi:predicted ATP-dependent serine protease
VDEHHTTDLKWNKNMGMVFCRGCGKELHETAPTCPQCGAPQGNLNSVIKDVTTHFKESKRKKQEEKLKQEELNLIQYKKELNRRKQEEEFKRKQQQEELNHKIQYEEKLKRSKQEEELKRKTQYKEEYEKELEWTEKYGTAVAFLGFFLFILYQIFRK